MIRTDIVSRAVFNIYFDAARFTSPRTVGAYTSPLSETTLGGNVRYFLVTDDSTPDAYGVEQVVGGFVIVDGELRHLFGPGYGGYMIGEAIRRGAVRLDCFDGVLVRWYSSHGFKEVSRVPYGAEYPSLPDGSRPDIVWMSL